MKGSNDHDLLVLRLSALGDVAIAIPVLLALKRHYPDIRLTLVTKTQYAGVFGKLPGANVFPVDTRKTYSGLSGLFSLYRDLKGCGTDLVADLHNVLRTRILGMLYRLDGVRLARIDKGRSEKKALTRASGKKLEALKTSHERYADVFRALGYSIELTLEDVLEREPWPEGIEQLKGGPDTKVVGVAPFAAHQGKAYPEELMEEVLMRLGGRADVRVCLFGGGKKEEEILARWEREYPHCVSMAGKVNLASELAVISNLDLMVSMDSGNGHLAAMYGVPVVTLWGVTHPCLGFAPFRQADSNALLSDRGRFPLIPTSVYGRKVPPGYDRVMESIPPESVSDKVLELLAIRQ